MAACHACPVLGQAAKTERRGIKMKEIQKRMLVQIILGFLLGRVEIFGINPIGIAYFAAGYTETGAKLPVAISVALGMFMALPLEKVLCGALAMLAVVVTVDFLDKKNIAIKLGQIALVLAAALGFLNFAMLSVMPHSGRELGMVFLESVLAMVGTRVLYDGIHFLLHAKKGQSLGNEEIISLVLLGAFGVLGLPNVVIGQVSVIWIMVFLLTLVMGYVYGTGAGAIAGTIGGSVMVLCGQQGSMIGVMALLGICSGMLREQGKLLLCGFYFLASVVLSYLVGRELMSVGELTGIAVVGVIFLLLPESLLGRIHIHAGGWEDNWESERLQKLICYKLKDFSNSFQNLASSFAGEPEEQELEERGQMCQILQAMTDEVCSGCENCANCSGQIALMHPDIKGGLGIAQEMGSIVPELMPVEFTKNCIKQELFLAQANQNLHMANVARGFQNRMLQSQKVIARQMREVGEIVGDLSEKLPVVQRVPEELQERIRRELRHRRVFLSDIAFYEKYDGRLEIHLRGRTGHGRYVTTREVCEVITELMGCEMAAKEECRKVFPREEEEFILEESAGLKAVSGVSRVPEAGEEVSGDTFSCMYLPGGELFMALSDGMGTGENASEESERVIELLEQMAEAGFSESSAIGLINSMYLSDEEKRGFATADIAVFNLYQKTGQFLKCGASTTYLCHEGGMELIEGEALPIGVVQDAAPYMTKTGINAGDYVIMMTDGVADTFSMEEYELEHLIWEYCRKKMNPQELAENILDEAVKRWDGKPGDDMSVMAVAFYASTALH